MARILEVINLSKSFSKKQIINSINFNIEQGEIIGFVGPNGAGKTTTLKLIANLIYPDSGKIIIGGYNLLTERTKALSNIAGIVENPGLYTYLSGKDNLNFIRKMNTCTKEKMNSIISYIGLSERINDTVKKYSLGMKQRLALGMCLLSNPKLLLLDEPTNGLDPDGIIEFRNLIKNLAQKENISILFSSHLLSEVEKVSDKIMFIKDGKIVTSIDNSNLVNSKFYKISVNNLKVAQNEISKMNNIKILSIDNENEILINIKKGIIGEVIKSLTLSNVNVIDIKKLQEELELKYNEIYKEF